MSHYLKCAHQIGRNRTEYLMPCDILKEMPDGRRVKVRVYGDRFWGGESSRIRYVSKSRILHMGGMGRFYKASK